jgi:Flp pilus assembly protein TadG
MKIRGCSRNAAQGAALVEFALVLPMLFILIVNVVNFAGFFYAWITVANAARAGADYAIMGPETVGSPKLPSSAQIQSLIASDVSSLRNAASLVVRVCARVPSSNATASSWDNKTVACPAGFSNPPAEDSTVVKEAPLYIMVWVDVAYTYQPFIPLGLSFPNLNLYVTLPSNLVIHRQAVMRVL